MNSISDKQVGEYARDESSMTSDQDRQRPGATAMRAGAQHRDSEFMVAQGEHGGAAPNHSKGKGPSSKVPNKEPVSHLHQMAPVHIGLKPSTIFSSIGGGRNSGSTTVGFGGSHGSSHVPPKEFVYRKEDFQPLGRGSSDNHIQTSLGMNPALFLSRQKAHFHVPSSSPSTSEGRAHTVLAHRDEKIKHHVPHGVNEPTEHRHQLDVDKCMDHNESDQHLNPSVMAMSCFSTNLPFSMLMLMLMDTLRHL
ncbi:hypothetical protein BGZ93_007304 [Podila epicladia]|nr:hypothetical protein BGZ92_007044 [Podila epicladia]KAG0094374.1 hypothetical protein BGZ93_007304 [Podila epicladia]